MTYANSHTNLKGSTTRTVGIKTLMVAVWEVLKGLSMGNNRIKYEYLPTDIFNHYDTHLVFTGVTRNSKKILKNITDNLEKVKPALKTVEVAHEALLEKSYNTFLKQLSEGWTQKKKTSDSITENKKIKAIDKELENNGSVIAHKLCGAGNGGFFLTFSKKNALTIPYNSVRIYAVPDGVKGESI